MKKIRIFKPCGLPLAALLLFALVNKSQAQFDGNPLNDNSYTNSFPIGANTSNFSGSGSVASWIYWYNTPGGNTPMTCNISQDAANDPTSGSLEVDTPPFGGSQNVFFGTFGNGGGYDFSKEANLILYTNISFDIHMDPATTAVDGSGNYGSIGVGIINAGYGYQQFGSVTITPAAHTGWQHCVVNIDYTQANLANAPGIAFAIANYGGAGGYPYLGETNYIDNIELHLTPGPPPPPPTLSKTIAPAITGFNQTAVNPGDQYGRQNIVTAVPTGYSFVGQPSVTYAWTNKAWPSIATATSWQQQFFLVSGVSSSGAPNGDPGQYDQAVDWNMQNVLWFTVQQNANGTGYIQMRSKTNLANGNGMLFNTTPPTFAGGSSDWPVQPLVQFNASAPVGPWSVTIAGTVVTITTPDNTSTNFTLDAATAALFADPMTVCLGSQANAANGAGQTEVISGFGVKGNVTPFSDNFTTDAVLNTNFWRVLASDPAGVNIVPPGSAVWVNWTLPDNGFSLQTAPSLPQTSFGWNNPSVLAFINNGQRTALVPSSATGINQGYFRLIQRAFSQLQVILPGETAAPGTPTGKTGTPTPNSFGTTGGFQDFVVNAVDANWFLVAGVTDNITVSSSDTGAFLPNGGVNMVNSVATFTSDFAFSTQPETATITAHDTTNNTITDNTSSPVTVGP